MPGGTVLPVASCRFCVNPQSLHSVPYISRTWSLRLNWRTRDLSITRAPRSAQTSSDMVFPIPLLVNIETRIVGLENVIVGVGRGIQTAYLNKVSAKPLF